MDLVARCKEKLSSFRIKELKDVLTQLGLSKQGKKQDLIERVLILLADGQAARLWCQKNAMGREDIAKLVDDTHRKMQVSGASDLASKGQVSSDTSNVKVKGEAEDSFRPEVKVRCVCGSSLETDSMIQCEDPRCDIWEHVGCVIVPEKSMDGYPPLPETFYCEVCRLIRADPFWVTVAHPLYPVRLTPSPISNDGTTTMQSVERTFQITRSDKDLLAKQEYDVQAWCMLLNDKVVFRREDGIVSPVKDQGGCGSCWTFSTTGALEAAYHQAFGKGISLSEQQLVDCAGAFDNYGCNGGLPSQAFEYIKSNGGLDTEEAYPYTGEDGTCKYSAENVGVQVLDSVNITLGAEDELKHAVGLVRPVSIAFEVIHSFRLYKSGVYSDGHCGKTPMDVNHAVLTVGYGIENGVPYWLIKNSWGADWGDKGYFKMEMGKNMCGIATCASYPVVA